MRFSSLIIVWCVVSRVPLLLFSFSSWTPLLFDRFRLQAFFFFFMYIFSSLGCDFFYHLALLFLYIVILKHSVLILQIVVIIYSGVGWLSLCLAILLISASSLHSISNHIFLIFCYFSLVFYDFFVNYYHFCLYFFHLGILLNMLYFGLLSKLSFFSNFRDECFCIETSCKVCDQWDKLFFRPWKSMCL